MSPEEYRLGALLLFIILQEVSNIIQTIITVGAVGTALITVYGIVKSVVKYICSLNEKSRTQQERNAQQDVAIARLKNENTLICYALSACLDGLEQLGANHTVPKAKDKLDKYLNQQAHK